MLKHSSLALQTSPGGLHDATNPKNVAARRPPQPSGLPIGPLPLSLPPCLAFPLPGRGTGRGRLRACLWLWRLSRLCSRRRGGRGVGLARARGGGAGRGELRAALPASVGRGLAAGLGAAVGAEGCRRQPARPAAPCLPRPAARPAGRDALCRPAPLRPALALKQKVWGLGAISSRSNDCPRTPAAQPRL